MNVGKTWSRKSYNGSHQACVCCAFPNIKTCSGTAVRTVGPTDSPPCSVRVQSFINRDILQLLFFANEQSQAKYPGCVAENLSWKENTRKKKQITRFKLLVFPLLIAVLHLDRSKLRSKKKKHGKRFFHLCCKIWVGGHYVHIASFACVFACMGNDTGMFHLHLFQTGSLPSHSWVCT